MKEGNDSYIQESRGYGNAQFVLGQGADGVYGHVALYLQVVPQADYCSVDWRVHNAAIEQQAKEQIINETQKYLFHYMMHRNFGLQVVIIDTTIDKVRQNDFARAVNLALRSALEDAGLPVQQIFG